MHIIFPYNFIYWNEVKNHNEIKDLYYSKILSHKEKNINNNTWLAKLNTSFNNENNFLYDNFFLNEVIWKNFDLMLAEKLSCYDPPVQSYVDSIWYNFYKTNDYQEVHDHHGPTWTENNKIYSMTYSGIYLMHLEEKNKTVFYQQSSLCPCDHLKNGYCVNMDFVEEGTVIFFPSQLSHYVLPSESTRCTVSFNLISEYNV